MAKISGVNSGYIETDGSYTDWSYAEVIDYCEFLDAAWETIKNTSTGKWRLMSSSGLSFAGGRHRSKLGVRLQ